MTTGPLRLAREVNLRIPAVLTAVLAHSRAARGPGVATATAELRAAVADLPRDEGPEVLIMAVSRFAAEIIDQVCTRAALDANETIDWFDLTYRATNPGGES